MAHDFYQKMERGKIGEEIVEKELITRKYITYKATDKSSHPFDFLVLNPRTGKITCVEVKYKQPLITGRFCLYDNERLKYLHQKEFFKIKELWVAFVHPETSEILWVEISQNPEKTILDKKNRPLCLYYYQNGGDYYANDKI